MPPPNAEPFTRCWRSGARRFGRIAEEIAAATGWLVFHPGRYGEPWHARFRRLYRLRPHPLLVFGLNPGPYGMAQTGVPFTDLKRLQFQLPRLWRELSTAGARTSLPGLAPPRLRPFLTRTFESSSVRVYRFLELAFGSAEAALREIAFVNPCPLLFIDPATGANCTPEDLPRVVRARTADQRLLERFDELRCANVLEAVELLRPRGAILLGRNAAGACGDVLREALGARRVVEWEHPARAVPEKWARGLVAELARRRLLRRSAVASVQPERA